MSDLKAILLDLTKSFACSGGSMRLVQTSLTEEGDQTFSINDSMSCITPLFGDFTYDHRPQFLFFHHSPLIQEQDVQRVNLKNATQSN